MTMNKNIDIKPDWNLIKLNERPYWSKEVQEKTVHNYGIYAFDRNLHTFCCEATPSYCLHFMGTELHLVEGMTEEEREQMYDYEVEADANSNPVIYMSHWDVERLIKESPDLLQHVDMTDVEEDEDPVDNIREGWVTGALNY